MVRAISYYGGKKVSGTSGLGRWIHSLVPYEYDTTYIEPFGGMLGIMLGRRRTRREIGNDLNPRIMNWWMIVQSRSAEFKQMLKYTPCHQDEYHQARGSLDEGDDLERAWKFHVVVAFSVFHADGSSGGFATKYSVDGGSSASMANSFVGVVDKLARRIADVELTNMPALDVLDSHADDPSSVIYIDPPYLSANTTPYAVDETDIDAMLCTLRQQRGRVAISGYRDDWDALGWERHEFDTHAARGVGGRFASTEVIWTNYAACPVKQDELPGAMK